MKDKVKLFNCKTVSEKKDTLRLLVRECREINNERVDDILIKALKLYKNKINTGGR